MYHIEMGFWEQCIGGYVCVWRKKKEEDEERRNEKLYGLYFLPNIIETIKSEIYGRQNM
jgi:hypothetical protein